MNQPINNNPLAVLSFAGLGEYQGPQELTRMAVLQVEGTTKVRIKSGEFAIVGEAGKQKGRFTWIVQALDPDLNNATFRQGTFANGVDTNGNPLARQTMDAFVSTKTGTPELVRGGAAQNAQMGPDQVIAQLVGKEGYVRFRHGEYTKDGKIYPTTEGDGFITEEQYLQSQKDGQHRVEKKRDVNPRQGGATVAPVGGAGAPPAFGGGAPPAFGGPAAFGAPAAAPTFGGGAPAGFPSGGPNGQTAAAGGFAALGGVPRAGG